MYRLFDVSGGGWHGRVPVSRQTRLIDLQIGGVVKYGERKDRKTIRSLSPNVPPKLLGQLFHAVEQYHENPHAE